METGRWIQPQRSLHNTGILCCASCGAMIPGLYWEVVPNGAPFCRPDCLELERRVETLAKRYDATLTPFPSRLRPPSAGDTA